MLSLPGYTVEFRLVHFVFGISAGLSAQSVSAIEMVLMYLFVKEISVSIRLVNSCFYGVFLFVLFCVRFFFFLLFLVIFFLLFFGGWGANEIMC